MTNTPPNSTNSTNARRKRENGGTALSFHTWKARVERAKEGDTLDNPKMYAGNAQFKPATVPNHRRTLQKSNEISLRNDNDSLAHVQKRFWGAFVEWVRRVTTLTSTNTGSLPMGFRKAFTLYSGRLHCSNDAGVTITAGLDITTEVAMQMNTMYSYYLSGSIVPLNINDAYAFVRVQPEIAATINIYGNAELTYASEVRKVIDTITYPGLAIKGIAAVGPTLDLWGQIGGGVTVAGNLRVGAKYTMNPIELYVPNNDETHDRATSALMDNNNQTGLEPIFEAQVKANVHFDVNLTPEVDMGIKVGGAFGIDTIVDAHVAAFVNTTLHFYAEVSAATTGLTSGWSYKYGVDFLYRIGLTCVAQVCCGYGRWQSRTYFPVPWQTINLYGPIEFNSVPEGAAQKRSSYLLSDEPLPGALFGTAQRPRPSSSSLETRYASHLMIGNESLQEEFLKREDKDGTNEETEFPPNTFNVGTFTCTTGPGTRCPSIDDDSNALGRRQSDTLREVGSYGGMSLTPRRAKLEKRVPTDCPLRLPRFYCE